MVTTTHSPQPLPPSPPQTNGSHTLHMGTSRHILEWWVCAEVFWHSARPFTKAILNIAWDSGTHLSIMPHWLAWNTPPNFIDQLATHGGSALPGALFGWHAQKRLGLFCVVMGELASLHRILCCFAL